MKKKTVKSVMIVAMLLAVSLYFVGGTYARYVSNFSGESTVSIAKWSVKLAEGSGTGSAMTLNLTAKDDENVMDGKIAPASSAEGEVEIELAGTEVAVELKAEVDKDAITQALQTAGIDGVTEHDITVETKVENAELSSADISEQSGYSLIKLPESGSQAFGETDKVKVTVTVKWDNAGDAHNTDHTKIGEHGGDIQIPVKLTAVQHIASEEYTYGN